ncbi:protocadherin alpha-5 [Burkholderiales bacterium GJ-E10]|nr:protocadherin alpha-5 [Burkholderiales bacterium GJ-E10]
MRKIILILAVPLAAALVACGSGKPDPITAEFVGPPGRPATWYFFDGRGRVCPGSTLKFSPGPYPPDTLSFEERTILPVLNDGAALAHVDPKSVTGACSGRVRGVVLKEGGKTELGLLVELPGGVPGPVNSPGAPGGPAAFFPETSVVSPLVPPRMTVFGAVKSGSYFLSNSPETGSMRAFIASRVGR